MIFSSRNYAIGMAHYQVAGGHKVLGLLVGGYVLAAGTIVGLIVHANPGRWTTDAMRATATFLLVIQAIGVMFFGSGRIATCIRVDTMNNMLESHRLMPVSSWRVVLSYLFGTTSQLIALMAVNAIVLVGVELAGSVSIEQFVISQVVLGFFALQVWTLMAMAAFMYRQALGLMVFGVVFGGMATGLLREFDILPGLSIVETPLLGETIFNVAGGGVTLRGIYYIAIPAQLGFSTLFFIGACRRYRGRYLTTFNIGMGIALVGLWGLLSALSINAWPEFMAGVTSYSYYQPQEASVQIVAALTVAAVLLIVPVHAFTTWEGVHAVKPGVRWLSLGATLLAALLPIIVATDTSAQVMSIVVITLHILTLYALLRMIRGRSAMTAGIIVMLLYVVLWLVPLLAEVVRWALMPSGAVEDFTTISMLSPLGLLMRAWGTCQGTPRMEMGVAFQVIVLVAMWMLAQRRSRLLMRQAIA